MPRCRMDWYFHHHSRRIPLFFGIVRPRSTDIPSFETKIEVVGLDLQNSPLIDLAIAVRLRERLKLPDAIIASTAIFRGAQLVTADVTFAKVAGLAIVSFEP